jgi:hypothetical protein
MTDYPITPPPELVQEWIQCWKIGKYAEAMESDFFVATQAAQWGADAELEACCEWVDWKWSGIKSRELRTARRPKPPSLKEQALDELHISFDRGYLKEGAADTIRRALEALPE